MLNRSMALLTAAVALFGCLFVGLVFLDFQSNVLGAIVFWLLIYAGWRLGQHIYRQIRLKGVMGFFASLHDTTGRDVRDPLND
jgi:hypothetical protein